MSVYQMQLILVSQQSASKNYQISFLLFFSDLERHLDKFGWSDGCFYEVDTLLSEKNTKEGKYYLVRWAGSKYNGLKYCSWQAETDVKQGMSAEC